MTRANKKNTNISHVLQEREQLLTVLRNENVHVEEAANELMESPSSSEEATHKYCKVVVASVDKILAAGDWDSSLFLKNVIKPIREMRNEAEQILTSQITVDESVVEAVPTLAENEVFLYVSLFQSKGHDLSLWEKQLKTLNRYLINRPVYAEEDNVKKVIRLKENNTNEAYVVLRLDKKYIQKPNAFEVERKDRYGNSLETVKPGVIVDSNIIELVYDGVRFRYIEGRLIKA
jgi:intracellular multiplication protein IcmQ